MYLYDHLDPAKGIACPFGYGKYVRRSEMKEHTCTSKYNQLIGCRSALCIVFQLFGSHAAACMLQAPSLVLHFNCACV